MAIERPGGATLGGNEFTLIGDELKVGDKAPDFTLPDANNNSVALKDYKGKKIVLWFFPKANTPG